MIEWKPEAVLWDMDGTIIDSEPLWLEAEISMLARFGIQMTDATHDLLIGAGLWDAAAHFQSLGVDLTADQIVSEWVTHVAQELTRQGPVWRPGARELLSELRDRGIPCALVTMSVRSLAELVIDALPTGTFAALVAGDEVVYPKPHPFAYLRAAELLQVPIEACIAVEDSPTGLQAAVSSGAIAVGVPHLLKLPQQPDVLLLSSLQQTDATSLFLSASLIKNK